MIIAFLGNIGPWQLIICLLVAFVLFGGAKKIPELAKSLGRAKGEFKKGLAEGAKAAEDSEKMQEQDEPVKEIS